MNLLSFTQKTMSARFFAGITIVSLLLSAFPVAFFVANAASTLVGPIDTSITTGVEYTTNVIDASEHENLTLDFSYDIIDLDNGDTLEYGWRTGSGDNDYTAIAGINADASAVVAVSETLPLGAQVADLEIYMRVVSSAGTDVAEITNLTVAGDLVAVVAGPVSNTDTSETFATIQEAIDDTDTDNGDIIVVEAGTYNENVVVNKEVSIIGAGKGPGGTEVEPVSGVAFQITTDNVTIEKISATAPLYAFEVKKSTGTVHDLALDEVAAYGSSVGFKVHSQTSIDGLLVSDSNFDSNSEGWSMPASSGNASNIDNVVVSDTTFNSNTAKGVYVEKLSNAFFDKITVDGSGNNGAASGSGFNVNLKYGDYTNVSLTNSTISNSGVGLGTGIHITARDDGSYGGSKAATLTGVTLENNMITNNRVGVRFGEPGTGNLTPTNVHVKNNDIVGNSVIGVDNQTNVSSLDAEENWWGDVTGPNGEGVGSGDVVNPFVNFEPWLCGPFATGPAVSVSGSCAVADITKPSIALLSPVHGDIVGTDFTVTGTATDTESGVVEVKYTVTEVSGIGGSYVANVDSGVASGTDNWSFDVTGVPSGFYRVKAQAFDAAGNWKYSTYPDVEVDAEKPTVEINYPDNGQLFRIGDLTATGTASDAQTSIKEVLYTVTMIDAIGGNYVASVDSGITSGTEDWSFDIAGLPTGFYRLKVQAFDQDGNWKYAYHDIEVDIEKPGVEIMYPAYGAVLYTGTFTATGTATSTDSTITEVKYRVNEITGLGGTYLSSVADGVALGAEAWSFDVENLTLGYYRLKVQAFEENGNWRYKYHDIQVAEDPGPQYGPYCGDGVKNGDWEMCDGSDVEEGQSCTDYCTLDNQCTDLQLIKVTLNENAPESTSFDGKIYLGSADNVIPNGTWFKYDVLGDQKYNTVAQAVDGLVVRRNLPDNLLSLAFTGGNASTHEDVVQGTVETKGIVLGAVNRTPNPQYKLEDGSGNSFDDVFTKNAEDTAITFDLRADTGNDAVNVMIDAGSEYDCPACKAIVEARIVLDEQGNAGTGQANEFILLGDGTQVAYGEWFALTDDNAGTFITDIGNATNYPDAKNTDGLFVSRNGDGTMNVVLYGKHSVGKINNEWIVGQVEVRDAEIASVQKLSGDYKFENHPETDVEDSNDGFDVLSAATDTSVAFKMWVDTGADGFKVTVADETIVSCEEDTTGQEPEPKPDTYRIDGFKYELDEVGISTLAGWNIYAENSNTEQTLATTTDANGYYYFDVLAGDWEITEEVQTDWDQMMVEQNGVLVITQGENVGYCSFDVPEDESELDCDFTNQYVGTEEEEVPVVPTVSSSRSSYSSGSRLRTALPAPLVLGASTSQCGLFLFDYLKEGQENSTYEVTKLQFFLNGQGYFIPVTGVFDDATNQAVRLFQAAHEVDVLNPWVEAGIVSHNRPTGWVYQLTRWKINNIICPGSEPLPVLLP